MSDTPNIDKAKAAAKALLELLEVNEAGTTSWHEAVAQQIDTISTLSSFKSAADDAYDILRRYAESGDVSPKTWCARYHDLRRRTP